MQHGIFLSAKSQTFKAIESIKIALLAKSYMSRNQEGIISNLFKSNL